jgi:hypothetical protein
VWHVHTGQSLDGLDHVIAQLENSEGGKIDVGDLLDYCRPLIKIYITHHLLKQSSLTGH